jgi:hypothetical protein
VDVQVPDFGGLLVAEFILDELGCGAVEVPIPNGAGSRELNS